MTHEFKLMTWKLTLLATWKDVTFRAHQIYAPNHHSHPEPANPKLWLNSMAKVSQPHKVRERGVTKRRELSEGVKHLLVSHGVSGIALLNTFSTRVVPGALQAGSFHALAVPIRQVSTRVHVCVCVCDSSKAQWFLMHNQLLYCYLNTLISNNTPICEGPIRGKWFVYASESK